LVDFENVEQNVEHEPILNLKTHYPKKPSLMTLSMPMIATHKSHNISRNDRCRVITLKVNNLKKG